MLATSGFGLLALFTILSALLGGDRRPTSDPTDMYRYAGRLFR